MSSFVHGLAAVVGAYLAVFYALCTLFPPSSHWPPNYHVVQVLSITTFVAGVVALAVGVCSLVRGRTERQGSLVLTITGTWALALSYVHFFLPPLPSPIAMAVYRYGPMFVWGSLVIGLFGLVFALASLLIPPVPQRAT